MPQSDWASENKTDDADYVEGDVYVNGDINIHGDTNVFGNVDAAGVEDPDPNDADVPPDGEVTGDPVTGRYGHRQQRLRGAPEPRRPDGRRREQLRRHRRRDRHHVQPHRLRPRRAEREHVWPAGGSGTHDNPHFHLQNGSSHTLSFGQSRDGNLILVKGTSGSTT